MHYAAQRCPHCGEVIPPEQVQKTMQAPKWYGASLEETGVLVEELSFSCSSYTEESGCEGNEPTRIAYWETP